MAPKVMNRQIRSLTKNKQTNKNTPNKTKTKTKYLDATPNKKNVSGMEEVYLGEAGFDFWPLGDCHQDEEVARAGQHPEP